MDDPQHNQVAFSDTLGDDVVAYRSLSALAVFALVVAVFSALALFVPWLGFLPVLAAVLSAAGLRAVRSNPDTRTGAGAASMGLALSVAVLVAMGVRDRYAQSSHTEAAQAVADEFINRLAEGDAVAAYELTLDFARRAPTPEAAAERYETDESAAETFDAFRKNAAIDRLLADADAGEFDPAPAGHTRVLPSALGRIGAAWRYELPATAAGPARGILVRLDRLARADDAPAAWRVSQVDFALDAG